MTKDDKDWLSDAANLGCISLSKSRLWANACRNSSYPNRSGRRPARKSQKNLASLPCAPPHWRFRRGNSCRTKDMGGQIRYRTGVARSGDD